MKNCEQCHGLIMEPGISYGYNGKTCLCPRLISSINPFTGRPSQPSAHHESEEVRLYKKIDGEFVFRGVMPKDSEDQEEYVDSGPFTMSRYLNSNDLYAAMANYIGHLEAQLEESMQMGFKAEQAMAAKVDELTQALKAAEDEVRDVNAMFVQERRDFEKIKAENERKTSALVRVLGIRAPGNKPQGPHDFENIFCIVIEALKDPEVK